VTREETCTVLHSRDAGFLFFIFSMHGWLNLQMHSSRCVGPTVYSSEKRVFLRPASTYSCLWCQFFIYETSYLGKRIYA
jgi:hypothetical protein